MYSDIHATADWISSWKNHFDWGFHLDIKRQINMSTWAHKTMYLLYPYGCHSYLTTVKVGKERKKLVQPVSISAGWVSARCTLWMALGVDEGPGERVLARDIQLWFIPRLCHISMTLDQFFNFFKSQFPRLQSGSDKNHPKHYQEVLVNWLASSIHRRARRDPLRTYYYCHCLLLLEETEFGTLDSKSSSPPLTSLGGTLGTFHNLESPSLLIWLWVLEVFI